ncbi:hypothetical protein RBU61_01985 [Tissierella sp. MB52-C2]|uniref:hypothetical protein n=1 Tax=Tissierella sp. MB52-C2 TaxID=3070999 RepID=UPI00280B9BB3|nr:hypothetical protein [Tissierella sp. MB52-C2]WMM25455.1 hypothetical protein RBU61_01985 [Tissierella sp. MB52-C2]
MRNRSKIMPIIVIILIVVITLVLSKYNQKQKRYEEYVDEKLNQHFYIVCDYIINSNAIIENAIENQYIFENDLEYLNHQFYVYLQSLDEINEISMKFKEFDFFSVKKEYDFNREYSYFYYNIGDLFGKQQYDDYSTKKHELSEKDLDVFKQSYEYTFKVVNIIKNHIDYYNMFDIVITETEGEERSHLMQVYKKEYLIPWPDNKGGSEVTMTAIEDGTVTKIPARYDYPKKPFISINTEEWISIYKSIYLLSINK